jgi:hypothetical protein
MANGRTVTTLGLLLAAMTAGAFLLLLMETAPIRPDAEPLAAYGTQAETPVSRAVGAMNVPLKRAKWTSIVVHTAAEAADIAQRCHFIVATDANGETILAATELWNAQRSGEHATSAGDDFANDSIGICLMADTNADLSAELFDTLVDLTRCLQKRCRINAASVYLNRDLNPASHSPGNRFPEASFTDLLLYVAD